jgi:hypothetical protein
VAVKPGMSANVLLRNGPRGKCDQGSGPIHPRSGVGAGLSKWSSFWIPSIKRQPCAAEELVDVGKSDHPAGNFKQMSVLYVLCL